MTNNECCQMYKHCNEKLMDAVAIATASISIICHVTYMGIELCFKQEFFYISIRVPHADFSFLCWLFLIRFLLHFLVLTGSYR